MCMNCITGTEVMVLHGAAGVAAARGGLSRLRARFSGRDPNERRLARHRANAEFLTSLGLDPDRVLGPVPQMSSVPAREATQRRPWLRGTAVAALDSGHV